MGLANKLCNMTKLFSYLTIKGSQKLIPLQQFPGLTRNISTSTPRKDLMEFFDDKKNWNEIEVKSGRSWNKDEIRLKSNSDLHKLWYILLKEKNMLLTMEQEAKDQIKLFPSPERLDKVEESMENLEAVVRERNVAYHMLETGETGERPGKLMKNAFGLHYYYKMSEYPLPKYLNSKWKQKYNFYKYDKDTQDFLLKYREKRYLSKKRKQRRDFNHVIGLLNRYPNMDKEALKAQYPNVNIEHAKRSRKYGGHFVPE